MSAGKKLQEKYSQKIFQSEIKNKKFKTDKKDKEIYINDRKMENIYRDKIFYCYEIKLYI